MKTNIKIVFKDGRECIFDANSFGYDEYGFYSLEYIDEDDNGKLVAYVSISEIRYLKYVEVKE